MSVSIKVYEAVTHRVTADTLEQALEQFLDDRGMWLESVDKRQILVDDNGWRPLTQEEDAIAVRVGL